VEHRLELLFEHVDTVIVMHMGSILAIDTPDAITRNAAVREVYLGD
jgi:branched-chain amino acid transport system ATP-binding protein